MSDYKLTLYADKSKPTGHFFVGVEGPGIKVPVLGKYSSSDNPIEALRGNPAEIRDDTDRRSDDGVTSREFPLSKVQAEKAAGFLEKVRADPGEYKLFASDCVSLAQSALDAAETDIRIDQSFTKEELLEMGGKWSPYGAGYDALRRGNIIEIDKIEERTKIGAERRRAIRDYINSDRYIDDDEVKGSSGPLYEGSDVRPNVLMPGADSSASASGEFGMGATQDPKAENREIGSRGEFAEASQLMAGLMPNGKENARAELLYKSADQLTDAEVADLGNWYHDLQASDPLRETLDQKRRDFYSLTYGDVLAKTDATGRMIQPKPQRSVPDIPTPAKAASGGTLAEGIKRLAGTLEKAAAEQGAGETVKGLQTGLNLGGASLKVDGIAGLKTRDALMKSLAEKGAGKTEEASALGGFKRFAESERSSGRSASGLKKTIEDAVQPLLGDEKPKAAAEALQESLNGLGVEAAKAKKIPEAEPLKIDGDIGTKTTDAFRMMLLEHGPERLAKRYGENLGFEF